MSGRYPWTRLTHPLTGRPSRDQHGWVVGESAAAPAYRLGIGTAPLSACRDVPVVVLLAERGSGKTITLADEFDLLRAECADAIWLDLADDLFDGNDAMTRISAALVPETGDQPRFVFLDSLDNAIDLIPQLKVVLRRCLDTVGEETRRRLRLRIACRTARWPNELQADLERLWPGEQVQQRALAGLARADVMIAWEDQVEAEAFLWTVEARSLVPLASLPVTLLPMLQAAQSGRALPATASEAYEEGCRLLCAEHRDHQGPSGTSQSGHVSLLAAATRVAAMLQLSRVDVAVTGPIVEAEPRGLMLASLEGGVEPTDQGEVACTAYVLNKLTESALFTPLGPGRIGFAHHSFQEFLTARYLMAHRAPLAVLQELFMIGDGPARHVVPWQREVAGWSAGWNDDLFEILIREDPEVLLVADLSARPASDRARVVDALFARTARDDTVRLDPLECRRLDHPDLAGQLADHLQPGTEIATMSAAIAIAHGCDVAALAGALLDLAEHTEVEVAARRNAITALPTHLTPEDRNRVRRLTRDTDPELAGLALLAFAHRQPTPSDLLSCTASTTAAGTYVTVVTRDLLTRMTWPDVPTVLHWAAEAFADHVPSATADAAVELLAWAAQQLADRNESQQTIEPDVMDKFAVAVLDAARRNQHTGRPRLSGLEDVLASNARLRQTLAERLLDHVSAEEMPSIVYGELTVFPVEDSGYWAQHLPDLPERKQQLLEASVVLALPAGEQDWELVYVLRREHSRLARMTEHWYVQQIENNPAREHALRRNAREQRAQAERDVFRFDRAVVEATLDGIMAGSAEPRQAWWQVALQLHRSADGDRDPVHLDLRRACSYLTADSDLRQRLHDAALVVLAAAPDIILADVRPLGVFVDDVPELTALSMLEPAELDSTGMTPAWWAGVTIALITLGDIDAEDARYREGILPICARRAGQHLQCVPPLLLDRLDDGPIVDVLNTMASILDAGQKDGLLSWARAPKRSLTRWRAVMRRLATGGEPPALRTLRRIVRTDPTAGAPATADARLDRWLQAANILIDVDLAHSAEPIWRIATRDTAIGDRLVNLIASRDIFAIGVLELAASEQQLGWLYEQLLRRSPPSPNPARPAGFIGPAQRLGQLRDRLPYILATRATPQASTELKRLADTHPSIKLLRMLWRGHVKDMAARAWQPLPPPRVAELVAATDRRIVQDPRQLRDVVIEALGRLQDALSAPNGLVTLLWNRDNDRGTNGWWPAWEDDLSDLVASFLRLDLAGRRVVINREVQVVRPNLSGQRLDIAVQANPRPGVDAQLPVTVIVECKGCWNSGLDTDLEQQLVDRYLAKPEPHAGIFLVGFFDCEPWKINHGGRLHRGRHNLDKLRHTLTQAARDQEQAKAVTVASVVLDCRLPERPLAQPAKQSAAAPTAAIQPVRQSRTVAPKPRRPRVKDR